MDLTNHTRRDLPSAQDVAAVIIARVQPDPMKLQKLLYFVNAWNLTWYDEPIFPDVVEGWREGPMVDAVYQDYKHVGWLPILEPVSGTPTALTDRDLQVLDAVLAAYGGMSGPELSDLTHQEAPWQEAWSRRGSKTRGRQPIDPGAVRSFHRRRADFGGRHDPDQGFEEAVRSVSSAQEAFERTLGVTVRSVEER
jgi:uncharacterized phage-associated protein